MCMRVENDWTHEWFQESSHQAGERAPAPGPGEPFLINHLLLPGPWASSSADLHAASAHCLALTCRGNLSAVSNKIALVSQPWKWSLDTTNVIPPPHPHPHTRCAVNRNFKAKLPWCWALMQAPEKTPAGSRRLCWAGESDSVTESPPLDIQDFYIYPIGIVVTASQGCHKDQQIDPVKYVRRAHSSLLGPDRCHVTFREAAGKGCRRLEGLESQK